MITKEKIKEYFEQEIENRGKLMELLYRDKKLMKEERFEEFATELLQKAKKAYWGSLAFTISFFVLGSMYLSSAFMYNSSLLFGSFDAYLGFAYFVSSLLFGIISTKEYYNIKGSMTMLLKLLETDEKKQPAPKIKLINA